MAVDLIRALAVAAEKLGVQGLRAVGEPLAGSRRAVVVRAAPVGADDRQCVVVKVFDTELNSEGWPRESAALSVLGGRTSTAPVLLAKAADPPLIVTADLGKGPSLADRMLGDDPAAAAAALRSWARALGGLHAATLETGAAFAAALTPGVAADSTEARMAIGIDWLSRDLSRAGLTLPGEAIAALRALPAGIGGPVALTPADACPDNNVGTPDGLVLVDFESATVRPVAWDLAYLAVPWPTCWCAFRLPDAVAAEALAEWRSAAGLALSTVDIARAAIGWAIASVGRYLGGALDGEHIGGGGRPVPPRRAQVLYRLGLVTGAVPNPLVPMADLVDPALRKLVIQLRATLVDRWGEQELPLAPAFMRDRPISFTRP